MDCRSVLVTAATSCWPQKDVIVSKYMYFNQYFNHTFLCRLKSGSEEWKKQHFRTVDLTAITNKVFQQLQNVYFICYLDHPSPLLAQLYSEEETVRTVHVLSGRGTPGFQKMHCIFNPNCSFYHQCLKWNAYGFRVEWKLCTTSQKASAIYHVADFSTWAVAQH